MGDASAGIPYRANAFLHVIQFAIFLAVDQNAAINISREHDFPHLPVELRRLLTRFQNLRRLAVDLFAIVACKRLERRVHVFDDPFIIGHHHGIGRLLDCTR